MRAPHQGGLTGHDIATCALIGFYAEGYARDLSPVNDRLLAYASLLVFEYDAPAQDLETYLDLLQAYLTTSSEPPAQDDSDPEAIRQIVTHVEGICETATDIQGLRALFARADSHLAQDEAVDEDGGMVLHSPQMLDETSPLGIFIGNCIEAFIDLKDDELATLMQQIKVWNNGSCDDGIAVPIANADVDALVDSALKRGDYAGARSVLEGSFTQPPAESPGTTLAGTLYRNAYFHFRTLALESAKEALEEALRLARGANEIDIIAKCDTLDRKIKLKQRRLRTEVGVVHGLSKPRPAPVTHSTDELQSALDEGADLVQALDALEDMSKQLRAVGIKRSTDATSRSKLSDIMTLETDIWRGLGSSRNELISIHARQALLEDMNPSDEPEARLGERISFAQHLDEGGRTSEAIEHLLHWEELCILDIDLLKKWHTAILGVVYNAARRGGFLATCDRIAALCPEMRRGMNTTSAPFEEPPAPTEQPRQNEATFGRQFAPTHDEHIHGTLAYVREMRRARMTAPAALNTAAEAREVAETSSRFRLARLASCEGAGALAELDMVPQTFDMLDEILPRVLSGNDVESKAHVSFAYAKALLHPTTMPKDRVEYMAIQNEAFHWLVFADMYCGFADCDVLLTDISYCKAHVLDNLDRKGERDTSAETCLRLERTLAARAHKMLPLLDEIQEVAALAGARIAAGR